MKGLILGLLVLGLMLTLVGCEGVSRPYVMKTDRVDQNLSVGNRGYLKGTPPPARDRGELKRQFIAVDVELAATGKEEEGLERKSLKTTRERKTTAPIKEKMEAIK